MRLNLILIAAAFVAAQFTAIPAMARASHGHVSHSSHAKKSPSYAHKRVKHGRKERPETCWRTNRATKQKFRIC